MKNTLVLFILGSALLVSCNKKAKETKINIEDAPTVEIAQIERKTLGETITASGVLASKSEIKLAFKTGGLIKRIYVNEGQYVKAGQLLAELDMSEIDAQVNQAKIGLQKAKRDFERVTKLYNDEAATQTNLQDATTGVDLATQTVQAANFNQKLSRIYAPTSGTILRKIAEQGELITPYAPAFVIGSGSSAFVVNVGLADRDIIKIKTGNSAIITFDAYPGQNFRASVSQIAQTVNPATGTYEVELEISNEGKKLISGFVANAKISPAGQNSTLVVPVAALAEASGQIAYVFCLEGTTNTVIRKEIKIGKITNEEVELISGLTEKDIVITKGGGFLSDGQKVKVLK
jgi:RND family efflux transporter MFP subunit